MSQERWDELVTRVHIPAPLDRVWEALTQPYDVACWLAVTTQTWAVPDREACLDFEDGEFFLCATTLATPAGPEEGTATLAYDWRWVGVGPPASVRWQLTSLGPLTEVTVTERAQNAPSDWRSWNGMGWPGILNQLATYLRLGRTTRWPWRRMGPYLQYELPVTCFEAWSALTSVPALQFWMGRERGSLVPGDPMNFILGDASGVASMEVVELNEANQRFPSYLPSLSFRLNRPGWPGALDGHLWIEPAGLGRSVVQVFHSGWEIFGPRSTAPQDRHLLTTFWADAFGRAQLLLAGPGGPPGIVEERPGISRGPHSWSA